MAEFTSHREMTLQSITNEVVRNMTSFRINWKEHAAWQTADGNMPVKEMPDRFLYDSIVWVFEARCTLASLDGAVDFNAAIKLQLPAREVTIGDAFGTRQMVRGDTPPNMTRSQRRRYQQRRRRQDEEQWEPLEGGEDVDERFTEDSADIQIRVKRWLSSRPLFRALLREAALRSFTFPDDVFQYIKSYVMEIDGTIQELLPWKDPNKKAQADTIVELRRIAPLTEEEEFGAPLRELDLD